MRLSKLFTKTRKNVPAGEESKNAQLLIKAGFIHKEMAGAYAYLPLGLKVLENIKQIIREEMNDLDGQEMIMTSLQRKELWEETDRWDDKKVDVWFKSKLQNGTEVGFGWSHEEPITNMMKNYISSYRDLPVVTYQFQTKLRNELRSKSGIMRGREFVMKDMYSYHADEKQHLAYYEKVKDAYMKVFDRVGLGDITYITYAAGGAFTKYSHEFQTITEAGEDVIYLHKGKNIAINEEVCNDETLSKMGVEKGELERVKAAEVGNIFNFGTSKTDTMDLYVTGEDGAKTSLYLASYGIGVTRLMGVVAEHFSDDKGLVWPANIAPAKAVIITIGNSDKVTKSADKMYKNLTDSRVEVLYDDRDARPGEKFADADLMGIPYRVVVSENTVASGKHELKARTEDKTRHLDEKSIIKTIISV